MRDDKERERVMQEGTRAWNRVKQTKDWYDWLKVGEALVVGRELIINETGANGPTGSAYNQAFGKWLERHKLDDMDKGDRSRLFEIMANLAEITKWRETLTQTERLRLNNPNIVLKKWKARKIPTPDEATEKRDKQEKKERKSQSVEKLVDDNTKLTNEIDRLTAYVRELEAALETANARIAELEASFDKAPKQLRNGKTKKSKSKPEALEQST